jgi:hypothetical protein
VNRLIDRAGLNRSDMFLADEQAVDRAYEIRERVIAYEDPTKVRS